MAVMDSMNSGDEIRLHNVTIVAQDPFTAAHPRDEYAVLALKISTTAF